MGSGDRAVAMVSSGQHELISVGQARICGLGREAVDGRVRRRQWQRVRRGVYLVGAAEPAPEAEVLGAVLAGGESAVASHLSAAWLWRLVPRLPRPLHITMLDASNPGELPGTVAHRPRTHIPASQMHRGIPVTRADDTLIDLAGVLPPDRLEAATAKALVDQLTSRSSLAAAVRAAGKRKGIATLREIVAADPKLTRSRNERAFLALVRAAELPEPQTNIVIEGKEIDAYRHDARLAVEIDAYSTHGDRASFEDDHLLDADFEAAGIELLRVTDTRIKSRPHAVVARLAATLALRLGGLPAPRRRR